MTTPTPEPASPNVREALDTAEAWLQRWAIHAGNCRGGGRCECGLTRARFEAEAALSRPAEPTKALDREAVARIIDPGAWQGEFPSLGDVRDRKVSLAKADDILALSQSHVAQAEGEGSGDEPSNAAKIVTYDDMHAFAVDLGFPSILEALESIGRPTIDPELLERVRSWIAALENEAEGYAVRAVAASGWPNEEYWKNRANSFRVKATDLRAILDHLTNGGE